MPMLEKQSSEKLLIDTHIWIWLMAGDERLTASNLKLIEQYAQASQLYISAISIWELGMLVAKKRIILQQDCLVWVNEALQAPGLHRVDLLPEIAVDSTRLPANFHGDPADRMIVATARYLNAVLMTKDERILEYARKSKALKQCVS